MVCVMLYRAVAALPLPFDLSLESDGRLITEATFVRRSKRAAKTVTRDALLREALAQVNAYGKRRLRRFDLPLKLEGPQFCVDVWDIVAGLETGTLISYGDVARIAGRPRAHRAVAMAMGRTPHDLLIPAHRVIGSDGTIKGAGPHSTRRVLLEFEGYATDAGRVAIRS